MNVVPIAFAFDNNLVLPACVCISSLMMNAKADTFYDIYILHSAKHGIDKSGLDRIPGYYNNCKIHYREIGNDFEGAFEIRGITTPAYYRLLIPEVIPEYDKIMYSDVDVIFRDDLSYLFEKTDLSNCYVAGVNSLSYLEPELIKYYNEIGIDSGGIIYSGNLIINSKLMREDRIVDYFRGMADKRFRYQDMDILNLVCQDRIKYLPPSFCATDHFFLYAYHNQNSLEPLWDRQEIEYALLYGVIHYNGCKPWKSYCVNFDIWWEYYRKSPFYDEVFYFDFFYSRIDEYDRLSFTKRLKILLRYFVYGKK